MRLCKIILLLGILGVIILQLQIGIASGSIFVEDADAVRNFTLNTAPGDALDSTDAPQQETFVDVYVNGADAMRDFNLSGASADALDSTDAPEQETFIDVYVNDADAMRDFNLEPAEPITPGNNPPIASFTYSPESPLVGAEITFDASYSTDSDGEIVSYGWDFGDESSGTGEAVVHSYSSVGDYTVTLTVTDDEGATNSVSKTVNVGIEGLLDVPFFSQRNPAWSDKKLDHSPYSIGEYGCALTSVAMVSKYFGYDTDPDRLNTSLTAVGGLDTSGDLHWEKVEEVSNGKVAWIESVEASWSRIDQELSDKYPVISSVKTPLPPPNDIHFIVFIGKIGTKHYFLDPYDEQETINEWPNGAHGEYTIDIDRRLKIYHPNQPPVADAGADQSVSSGDLVLFDGSNSYDPDGSIVNYEWDFGDGETAEGHIVSHRFRGTMNEARTYTVTLTVEDDSGTTASDITCVTVIPLEKTVPVEGLGYKAGMTASYNWVKVDESGEDVYIVSKITSYAALFRGGCEVDIHDGNTGISMWRDVYISHDWLQERTWVSPFTPNTWIGIPCSITKLTFPEDAIEPIEVFEGIEVHGNDDMAIGVLGPTVGITLKPSLIYDEARTKFYPDSPVEQLGPAAKVYFDLLVSFVRSPVELRIYDSEGNVTGVINGEVKKEIQNSDYDEGTNTVVILCPSNSYRYEVVGTGEGTYGLTVCSLEEEGEATNFTATDIPTTVGATHEYNIDWGALSQGEEGTTVQVDSDGDGEFEYTFTADDELTQDEYLSATNAPPIADANGPYIGVVDSPIAFDGTGSYDQDGTIVSYEWDLDDDGEFDDATGPTPTKTWDAPYSGNIRLRVTDNDGATGIDSTTLTVEIPANVIIKPETLNLKSKGHFTAFITLPEPYNITDINISTVVCEEAPAVKGMAAGDNKYIAKFDREDLRGDLPTGDEVEMRVNGKVFYNGGYVDFEGCDTIRVIDKGKGGK